MSIPTNITTTPLPLEEMYLQLRREAFDALEAEPEMNLLLQSTILSPEVKSFQDAIATTVSYRLLGGSTTSPIIEQQQQTSFSSTVIQNILLDAMHYPDPIEKSRNMAESVGEDILAVYRRDPACDTLLEVLLFYKGFAALVCHRAARYKWKRSSSGGRRQRRSFVSLWLQSQASAVFGVDIHPAATIGAGVLMDHGTGIVIGETAHIGDGCTLLHGVTLGGTGKDHGDRHPKVGKDVLIGAGASILGNISIGNGAKIGAGSIVLRPIPDGATAVGAPAKILGIPPKSPPREKAIIPVCETHLKSESSSVMTSMTCAMISMDVSTTSDAQSSSICSCRPINNSDFAPSGMECCKAVAVC